MKNTIMEKHETEWQAEERRRREWLATLKPGDQFAVSSRYGNRYTISTVSRVTKTQVITPRGMSEARFNRESGRLVGSDSYDRIEPVTPAILEAIDRAELTEWLQHKLPRKKFTTAQLRALHAYVQEIAPEA